MLRGKRTPRATLSSSSVVTTPPTPSRYVPPCARAHVMYASTCMPALHFYGARRMQRYKAVSMLRALSFSFSFFLYLSALLSLSLAHAFPPSRLLFLSRSRGTTRDARSRVPREFRKISSRRNGMEFLQQLSLYFAARGTRKVQIALVFHQ